MGEGARHALHDQLQDGFNVPHHVASGDTNYMIALLVHVPVAMHVPIRLVAKIVPTSVHLDNKLRLPNVKIRDVGSDRMLAPDFEPQLASPKLLPSNASGGLIARRNFRAA